MICKKCGKENPDNILFCCECGANLRLSFKDGVESKVSDIGGFAGMPNPNPVTDDKTTPAPTPTPTPSGKPYPRAMRSRPAPQYYPKGTGAGSSDEKKRSAGSVIAAVLVIVLCMFIAMSTTLDKKAYAAKLDEYTTEATTTAKEEKNEAKDGAIGRTPGKALRYWRTKLSDKEAEVYDYLVEGISVMKSNFKNLPAKINKKSLKKIQNYISYDYPELSFWSGYEYTAKSNGTVKSVSFKYVLSKDEKKELSEKISSEYSKFTDGVNDSMSDYEVVLRVFENIVNQVDYDSVELEKHNNNEKYKLLNLGSLKSVFVRKKAICSGYAKSFQYIMNNLGIKCIYVEGDADGPHAWNMVKLDGDWYYIDVTWGDLSNTDSTKDGGSGINYTYFCITTEELLRTHTPDNKDLLPKCTATKCNYFTRMNLCIDKYDYDAIRDIVKDAVSKGNYRIPFKCGSKETYKKTISNLFDDKKFYDIIEYCNKKLKANLKQKYTYSYDKDNYVITLNLSKE